MTLISQGKAAVEAELSRIEKDLSEAKLLALQKSAAIAGDLQKYLETHAAEVATAQALIAKATGTVQAASPVGPPVAHLASVPWYKKALTWIKTGGWKLGMIAGAGLVIVHYSIGRFL